VKAHRILPGVISTQLAQTSSPVLLALASRDSSPFTTTRNCEAHAVKKQQRQGSVGLVMRGTP